MPLALDITHAAVLAFAAFLSACSGAASTAWAIHRGRREEKDSANEKCRERLKQVREEAEDLAEELYQHQMARLKQARNEKELETVTQESHDKHIESLRELGKQVVSADLSDW